MEFTDKAVRAGSDVKGDLLVTMELGGQGRKIEINSKVAKKFGASIEQEVNKVLDNYKIADAKVQINDLGAFAFAVTARLQTACKRMLKGVANNGK